MVRHGFVLVLGRRGLQLFAGLVAIVAAVVMAVSAPAASAANTPFTCDAFGYLFQTNGTSTTHSVIQIDLATGAFNPNYALTPGYTNAVGYNVLDNYMYGMQLDAATGDVTDMVRIHADGTTDSLGIPVGLAAVGSSIVTGDVDSNGHYWVLDQAANPDHWYEIDLVPGSPTYGQILNQGNITQLANVLPPSDWVYINGKFYGLPDANPATTNAHLVAWTPGATSYQDLGATSIAAGSGAVYTDAAGYLYASINATGDIYRINVSNMQTVLVSHATASTGNDGARCARAPIPTITVTKTVGGRIVPADQFTVGLVEDTGRGLTSATTTGAATSASTTNFPVSQGHTYTITDAMATGSTSPLSEYVKSIVCTDAAGNVVATGGSAPNWTLAVANATDYTCNVTNKAEADLEIEKTASPSPAVPGTDETYSLKVTNHGPSTAVNVSAKDPLPSGLTFASASSGCSEASGTVTCTLGSLAPGASHTFTVTTHIASSVNSCSDLRNTATVSSAIFDPDLSNNSSMICPIFKGKADLSITKTASQTQVAPGGQVMYTLVVKNNGPSDDTGVTVVDPLAQGLTLVSANPSQGSCSTANGQVSCSLGALIDGGSAQILVTAQVSGTPGAISNTATVTGDAEDPDPTNNHDGSTVTVVPGPEPRFDLVMDKTANHKTIKGGRSVTYTLAVTNSGPDAAPDVKVTDTLSAPATIVSIRTTQGSCTKSTPLSCSLGTIPAGGKVTITVVARPTTAGSRQRNAASATGDGTDTNPANNLDHVDLAVKVDLRLTKVADRTTVSAGGRIHYTIRATNPSKLLVKNVRICDTLPSGLVYVSAKPKATLKKGSQCWTISSLAAHASKTFKLTVRALNGASGSKTNRVTATGAGVRTKRAHRTVHVLSRPPGAPPVTG